MQRPKVDETLCFICQKEQPTYKAERLGENFVLCNDCLILVEGEVNAQNRIKKAIKLNDSRNIFSYTLGLDLTPIQIKTEKI